MTQTEVFETEMIDLTDHSFERLLCDFFHFTDIGGNVFVLNF